MLGGGVGRASMRPPQNAGEDLTYGAVADVTVGLQ